MHLAKFGFFFVGGRVDSSIEGSPMIGHMYVEYMIPEEKTFPYPLIMIHGGSQTGTNFTGTPDGREGWAQFFVRRGYSVYVVDQVARGRSAHWSGAHGGVENASLMSSARIERRWTAPRSYMQWPQAERHNQFPGSGLAGDTIFQQFFATQFPSIADLDKIQELNRDALIALLDKLGSSVLLTHSQSGPIGWLVGDARPALVKGIVAVEPSGPPVHNTISQPRPVWFKDDNQVKSYGLTNLPLTYDPPVSSNKPLKFVRQESAEKTDHVRCWKQDGLAAKLANLAGIPITILTGEASYHAAYDHCTAAYLTQAGVANTYFRLEDIGIGGNGHMMMIEMNSDAIAAVIADWLEINVCQSNLD
ncbi:hypothetical protein BHU16_09210 [Tannerella sp. oral taxon 808]|nr:hypothetical protein BHU16_09210 [Tannerella sp. oral taxon 808]